MDVNSVALKSAIPSLLIGLRIRAGGIPSELVQHAEYPIEIYYSVNITPAITLRPNIQFIHALAESMIEPTCWCWVFICRSNSEGGASRL